MVWAEAATKTTPEMEEASRVIWQLVVKSYEDFSAGLEERIRKFISDFPNDEPIIVEYWRDGSLHARVISRRTFNLLEEHGKLALLQEEP